MLLNGAPLNSAPLNGASLDGNTVAPQPVAPEAGSANVWALRVVVGGDDVTDQLTGIVTIDREEGAAGVGELSLYIAPGATVVPPAWRGRPVTVDYIASSGGASQTRRRYTGQVAVANWNPASRVLACELSDQLQQRVESMTIEAIDALIGGFWSADSFEPVERRSRWDYALERLGTRAASLDCSPAGELRVSSWFARSASFVFGDGAVLYGSVELEQADMASTTNRIEIEFSYRYPRLWQRNQNYTWSAGSFCTWRSNTHELPTKEMILDAVTGSGQSIVSGGFTMLPPSASDPCGDGVPWINQFDNLVLGTNISGGRRWVQPITETYTFTLAAPAGTVETTQVIQRRGASLQVNSEAADEWAASEATSGSSGYQDRPDDERRDLALLVALHEAGTELVAAHRQTTLSWQSPASAAAAVDLSHTLEINAAGVRARGKCRRIVDTFDLAAGSAVTTLSIALMYGGGGNPVFELPPRLALERAVPEPDGGLVFTSPLPSQIGGRSDSGSYDEARMGFSGNWDLIDNYAGQEPFPRRFAVEAKEIPATDRDEILLTEAQTYPAGGIDDLLEM